MNLRDLTGLFRDRVQDTVKPYLWPDAEVTNWINEAAKEAAIRSRLIFESDEFAVSEGDRTIDLPGSLFEIRYVELVDVAGNTYEITATDRQTLDTDIPGWRRRKCRPDGFVHDDKAMTLNATSDAAYTLYIEFYRIPKSALSKEQDSPEFSDVHHEQLIDWVEFRGYLKPDAETFDPGKSKDAEARFEAYFGKRPTADLRRKQNADTPHHNRVHL